MGTIKGYINLPSRGDSFTRMFPGKTEGCPLSFDAIISLNKDYIPKSTSPG
jgi:hypothetical protein